MISNDNPIDDASVPPTPEAAIRAPNFRATGQAIGDGLGDSDWLKRQTGWLQDWIVDTVARIAAQVLTYVANIILFFGQFIVKTRERLDEPLAMLASEGISDLFGQELQADAFAKIGDHAGRKDIARVVGDQILRGLALDLANTQGNEILPSDDPAKAYLTRMAELSIEGWFEEIATNLISTHPFEKIGELKEEVSRTFGFSRLTRRVLGPAVDTLVVEPFKWKLNKQYRSKMLSEGTAVEMYLRGLLKYEELQEELARQGYSNKRIDNLIAERQKVLSVGDVITMWQTGAWTYEQATSYLQQQGYSQDVATLLIEREKQRQIHTARQATLNAARTSYVHRFIEVTEFSKYVQAAVPDIDIQHEIITQASAERELNQARISEGKAETAVIDGFWTLEQYTEHLRDLGFSDDDVLTMQLLIQEKIKEGSDKVEKKKTAVAAAAAAKQAKLLAAQQRQAQLDQQRSHRALTLGQVHRAYVQGKITLGQLHDFLVNDKQAADDIDELLTLAQAERSDYEAAQAKKARVNEKLAVTTLTASQLEHLVKTEQLTINDYQDILEKEGVSAPDVLLLVKAATMDLQATQAAKAHREAVAAKQAAKGLSLGQMEQAVRQDLRTIDDFKKWLSDNGYAVAEQASLVGLLQDRIAADKAAEEKKSAAAARLQHKTIPLAQLETAVRDGLRPISDYHQALIENGVIPHDADTLVALLQRKMADDVLQAKRKAEAATRAATKGITLSEVERAARLGIVSESYYRNALAKAGMPAEDQDVMVLLLRDDIVKVKAARQKQAEAEAKLKSRPVTLANLKHGVVLGIRTLDDYRVALQDAGFDAEAVDLMVALVQDEMAQAKTAAARKAELDEKRSTREIARADFEKAVQEGIKTLDDYAAFLQAQNYDEEDQGILYQLLANKVGG